MQDSKVKVRRGNQKSQNSHEKKVRLDRGEHLRQYPPVRLPVPPGQQLGAKRGGEEHPGRVHRVDQVHIGLAPLTAPRAKTLGIGSCEVQNCFSKIAFCFRCQLSSTCCTLCIIPSPGFKNTSTFPITYDAPVWRLFWAGAKVAQIIYPAPTSRHFCASQ